MTNEERDDAVVRKAIRIMEKRASYTSGEFFTDPSAAKQFAFVQLAGAWDEHFMAIFLTSRHELIAAEIMFSGTIAGASVHPRVVARRALELNAAAVIFAHNHPSGLAEPSQSDVRITQRLKDALALFEVRVLDHMIVGCEADKVVSLAERGLC